MKNINIASVIVGAVLSHGLLCYSADKGGSASSSGDTSPRAVQVWASPGTYTWTVPTSPAVVRIWIRGHGGGQGGGAGCGSQTEQKPGYAGIGGAGTKMLYADPSAPGKVSPQNNGTAIGVNPGDTITIKIGNGGPGARQAQPTGPVGEDSTVSNGLFTIVFPHADNNGGKLFNVGGGEMSPTLPNQNPRFGNIGGVGGTGVDPTLTAIPGGGSGRAGADAGSFLNRPYDRSVHSGGPGGDAPVPASGAGGGGGGGGGDAGKAQGAWVESDGGPGGAGACGWVEIGY